MSCSIPPIPINIPPESLCQSFFDGPSLEISAQPGTDLWRKPPSHDVSNIPCYLFDIPITSFRRARVTVTASWQRQYDQGGIVLFLPAWPARTAWVKAGVEYYMGKCCMSVVAAQTAADWSLSPGTERVTLEVEREQAGGRSSLWVYIIEDGIRTPVRNVTWAFAADDATAMMSVGVYTARPTKEGDHDTQELSVKFSDWELNC